MDIFKLAVRALLVTDNLCRCCPFWDTLKNKNYKKINKKIKNGKPTKKK